jgi:hypothetical protein
VAACALALGFLACGIEEFPTSLGRGAIPGDPLNPLPVPVEVSCDVACHCTGGGGGDVPVQPPACDDVAFGVDDLSGRGWRFDALTLTAPIPPGLIADGLNDFFADQMEAGTLNVLLVVDADDRETCALAGRLGSGAAAGAGHRFTGAPSPIALTLTNAGFATAEPSSLEFPNDLLTPPVLPLQNVALTGRFTAEAGAVEAGTLTAVLTVEDARGITLMGTTFDVLLGSLNAPPDLDLDEDGTNDAWRFRGDFTAVQTTIGE